MITCSSPPANRKEPGSTKLVFELSHEVTVAKTSGSRSPPHVSASLIKTLHLIINSGTFSSVILLYYFPSATYNANMPLCGYTWLISIALKDRQTLSSVMAETTADDLTAVPKAGNVRFAGRLRN